jgi:pyrimidine deaminase RibD-like protein
MRRALDEARRCQPVPTAYCVGCVVVAEDGRTATGHSRETSPIDHAEETAIRRSLESGLDLTTATLYVTMEPCGHRASKPLCCADLIAEVQIPRIAFAAREPDTFSIVSGADKLTKSGRDVLQLTEFADEALEIARG